MGKSRGVVIAAALCMSALLLVSCSSGNNAKKDKEVKQLLTQLIESVDKLEKENRDLRLALEHAEAGSIIRDNQSIVKDLEQTKEEKEKLKEQTDKLEGVVAHTQMRLEAKEEKAARAEELEKENKNLREELSKVKGLLSFTRLQLEAKQDKSALVEALEKKNEELNSLLNKIYEISKGEAAKTLTPGPPAEPAK